MPNLCIIPARGGSKRIQKKNIRLFCGKPMIAWSIEAALKSKLFEHVVVSTDNEEIAAISKSLGAKVPFKRPIDLADDYTPTRPVIIHAIQEIERKFGKPDFVCSIYPTAPFIKVSDLIIGYEELTRNGSDFAFTITSFAYPIQRALKITKNNRVEMFQSEYKKTRSQDLEPAYHDAGQFYWGKTDAFLNNKDTFSSIGTPIVLPNWRVYDIDTEEDWVRAEMAFKILQSSSSNS